MKEKFLEDINNIPKQFFFEPKIINGQNLKFKKPQYFIILAMGGSALAGDLLKIRLPKVPLIIHKNYGLPNVSNEILKDSLIIAISYSGKTEEIIDGYNQAKRKKLNLAVISTGGLLLSKAKQDKKPFIELPNLNIQPRLAIGVIIKSLAVFIDNQKIINEFLFLSQKLKVKKLQKQGENLAEKLFNYIPIIYASEKNKALSYQWKISFNENAKIPAFYNVFPELNHNEMSSFENLRQNKKLTEIFYFIFIHDNNDDLRIQKRMKILKNIWQEKNFKIQKIKLEEKTDFEKIFSSILLANFTSYYLSQKYSIDSEKSFLIENFKKIIADK